MALRKALVLINGALMELPNGDSLSAGGSDTQIQFNSSGGLAGAAALNYAATGTHLLVSALAATHKPLVVKAFASQTANLFEIQNSSSTNLLEVDSAGKVGIGIDPSYKVDIDIGAGGDTGIRVTNTASAGGAFLILNKENDGSKYRGAGLWLTNAGTLAWLIGMPRRGGSSNQDIFTISSTLDINSTGGQLTLNTNGNCSIGGGWAFNDLARLSVVGSSAGKQVLVVKMAASQTASAIEIQNSSATVLSKFKASGALEVPDGAYDASTWDSNLEVPTKNAIRDKIQTMIGRMIPFYASAPVNATIPLISSARFACTISGIYNLKTASGTVTAAIQINGTNVTSLSSLSVTSTPQSPTASGAFTVAVGDRVTLVLSSASTPVDLEFTLGLSV